MAGQAGPRVRGELALVISSDYVIQKNSILTHGLVFVLGLSEQMLLGKDDQVTGLLCSEEPGESPNKVHQHTEGKPVATASLKACIWPMKDVSPMKA